MSQQTRKNTTTLQHLFGSPRGAFLAVLVLLTLGWTINGGYDTLKSYFLSPNPLWWQPTLLGIVPFSMVLAVAIWEFLRIRRQVHPKIERHDKHDPVQVILLFLSIPTQDRKDDINSIDQIIKNHALTSQEALKQLDKHSWVMPLKGLEPHQSRLNKVIVISSKDSPGKDNGTYRHLDLFRKLVQKCFGETIPVIGLEGFDPELAKGIDFEEETSKLVDVIEKIYQSLATEKYATRDILIDITSGQKTSSIIGAAVSLADGRLFQYVSTQTKKVEFFDLAYQIDNEG